MVFTTVPARYWHLLTLYGIDSFFERNVFIFNGSIAYFVVYAFVVDIHLVGAIYAGIIRLCIFIL